MHLLIDNYDSFTWNIVQSFQMLNAEVVVRRNDKISLGDIERLQPKSIVISPGPCSPAEAGGSLTIVRAFARRLPIFGICLGHQCIAVAFGGRVRRAATPRHGKRSVVRHNGHPMFADVPHESFAGFYHSLVVDDLPDELRPIAKTVCDATTGRASEIMGISHVALPIFGVQFHPESIMTDHGMTIMRNFLAIAGDARRPAPRIPERR